MHLSDALRKSHRRMTPSEAAVATRDGRALTASPSGLSLASAGGSTQTPRILVACACAILATTAPVRASHARKLPSSHPERIRRSLTC